MLTNVKAIHSPKHNSFYTRIKQDCHKIDHLNHFVDFFTPSEEQSEELISGLSLEDYSLCVPVLRPKRISPRMSLS